MARSAGGKENACPAGGETSADNMSECQNAIKKGEKARVFFLLTSLASIDALGTNGFNVLHFATCYGRLEIAQALLEEYGANVHTPTLKGNTALHIACFEGFCDMIDLLLRNGASCDDKNNQGKTPLQIAQRPRTLQVVTRELCRLSRGRLTSHTRILWTQYYSTLGLGVDANGQDVEDAFESAISQLPLLSDPDRDDKDDSMVRACEVCESYLVLRDPANRTTFQTHEGVAASGFMMLSLPTKQELQEFILKQISRSAHTDRVPEVSADIVIQKFNTPSNFGAKSSHQAEAAKAQGTIQKFCDGNDVSASLAHPGSAFTTSPEATSKCLPSVSPSSFGHLTPQNSPDPKKVPESDGVDAEFVQQSHLQLQRITRELSQVRLAKEESEQEMQLDKVMVRKVQAENAQLKELVKDRKALAADFASQTLLLESRNDKITSLAHELRETRAALHREQYGKQEQQEKLNEVTANSGKLAMNTGVLHERQSQLLSDLEEAKAREKELQAQVHALNDRVADLWSTAESLRSTLHDTEMKRVQAAGALELAQRSHYEEVKSMGEQLACLEEQIKILKLAEKEEQRQQQQAKEVLQERLSAVQRQEMESVAAKRCAVEDKHTAEERLAFVEQEKKAAHARVEALVEHNVSVQRENAELAEAKVIHERLIQELELKINELKARPDSREELAHARSKISKLETQVQLALRSEQEKKALLQQLADQLELAKKMTAAAEARQEQAKVALVNREADAAALESALEALEAQLAAKGSEVESVRAQLQHAQMHQDQAAGLLQQMDMLQEELAHSNEAAERKSKAAMHWMKAAQEAESKLLGRGGAPLGDRTNFNGGEAPRWNAKTASNPTRDSAGTAEHDKENRPSLLQEARGQFQGAVLLDLDRRALLDRRVREVVGTARKQGNDIDAASLVSPTPRSYDSSTPTSTPNDYQLELAKQLERIALRQKLQRRMSLGNQNFELGKDVSVKSAWIQATDESEVQQAAKATAHFASNAVDNGLLSRVELA